MEEIAEDEEVIVTSGRDSFDMQRERTCATAAESLVIGRMNARCRRVKTCDFCREKGHWQRFCPKRVEAEKQAAAVEAEQRGKGK